MRNSATRKRGPLRFSVPKTYDQRFEIVSVVGTISCEGAHIHLGLADATGAGVGGHLISATVFTTAEIVLG